MLTIHSCCKFTMTNTTFILSGNCHQQFLVYIVLLNAAKTAESWRLFHIIVFVNSLSNSVIPTTMKLGVSLNTDTIVYADFKGEFSPMACIIYSLLHVIEVLWYFEYIQADEKAFCHTVTSDGASLHSGASTKIFLQSCTNAKKTNGTLVYWGYFVLLKINIKILVIITVKISS